MDEKRAKRIQEEAEQNKRHLDQAGQIHQANLPFERVQKRGVLSYAQQFQPQMFFNPATNEPTQSAALKKAYPKGNDYQFTKDLYESSPFFKRDTPYLTGSARLRDSPGVVKQPTNLQHKPNYTTAQSYASSASSSSFDAASIVSTESSRSSRSSRSSQFSQPLQSPQPSRSNRYLPRR